MQRKLVMLFGVIILAFVFLIGCITYINASKGEKYTKVVLDQQQYNNRTIPFKRGDIVDRNGTKLATSERVYNVVVDAKVITSNKKYMNPTVKVLAECFSLKKKAIRTQVKKNPNSRGSPTRQGLFFVRLLKTCISRPISSSLPMTGSSFPSSASAVRSVPY